MPNAPKSLTRRRLIRALVLAPAALAGSKNAFASPVGESPLDFLDRLPTGAQKYFADDVKLLIGWVTDSAVAARLARAGDVVDRGQGFASVPGFAAPTDITALSARYRLLADPINAHGYYGIMLGLLGPDDRVMAVLLVNRLFRLPVILYEPIGLATDLATNAGLMFGFRNAALNTAMAAAASARDRARDLDVPLIVAGQSQAGGTAQLQIAVLAAGPDWRVGQGGFITMNAANAGVSIRRLGLDPARLPGVNFEKDLDPGFGPHTLFPNRAGLQIYIHADGSGGLTPKSWFLPAMLHPRQHFLDSFNAVSLSAALAAVRGV